MHQSFGLRATLVLLATTTFIACGRPPPQSAEAVRRAAKGVVAIATRHAEDGSMTLCSGALVAPNLVLTARHCVSLAVTATPACDSQGTSHNGIHLGNDENPALIAIYTGNHVDVSVDAPRAYATKTIHPTTRVLCDSDVAFLVLDRTLDDVEVLPMRLDAPVETGEYVMPVGFGGGFIGDIGTRVPRAPSPVLTVGPGHNSSTGAVLGPREFEVDEATCRGDSGGPALDVLSGQVIGVVSRGRSCFSDGNHVYTRIDAYASLAHEALRQAQRELQEHVARR
jgi:S1-C subfamily serine protease